MSRRATGTIRRSLAITVTIAAVAAVAGCSVGADERVVGKQWQVTGIYDDPALPHAVPADVMPPMITIGGRSYTLDTGCGSYQGDLTWRDRAIVEISEPDKVRRLDCDARAETIDERFRGQLVGEFLVGDPGRDLRMTAIGDHPIGEAAPGWAAITRGETP